MLALGFPDGCGNEAVDADRDGHGGGRVPAIRLDSCSPSRDEFWIAAPMAACISAISACSGSSGSCRRYRRECRRIVTIVVLGKFMAAAEPSRWPPISTCRRFPAAMVIVVPLDHRARGAERQDHGACVRGHSRRSTPIAAACGRVLFVRRSSDGLDLPHGPVNAIISFPKRRRTIPLGFVGARARLGLFAPFFTA